MGNVSSAFKKHGRGKTWKRINHKLKPGNLIAKETNCTEISLNTKRESSSPKNNIYKMINSKEENVLDSWDQSEEIENVISPENVASQVVSLVRESIKSSLNEGNADEKDLHSILDKFMNISKTGSEVVESSPDISELVEVVPADVKHVLDVKTETLQGKEPACHKSNAVKKKEYTQNLDEKNHKTLIADSSHKGILKKENENETVDQVFLSGDYNYNLGEDDRLQQTSTLLETKIPLSARSTIPIKMKTGYLFENKRKKCVRFDDKVVIAYYTSADCQHSQRNMKNGSFIASVEEPLKLALQQQERNRELRNKFAYTHTVFPTAIKVGKV